MDCSNITEMILATSDHRKTSERFLDSTRMLNSAHIHTHTGDWSTAAVVSEKASRVLGEGSGELFCVLITALAVVVCLVYKQVHSNG